MNDVKATDEQAYSIVYALAHTLFGSHPKDQLNLCMAFCFHVFFFIVSHIPVRLNYLCDGEIGQKILSCIK